MKQLDPKYVWKYFLIGFICLFILFLSGKAMVLIPFLSTPIVEDKKNMYCIMLVLLITFLVFIPIIWVAAKLSYRFYLYEIRKEGFRKESGIIWKSYTTIPYGRIQNVDIHRGLLDRILGLSCVDIHTAGNNSPQFSEGRLPGLSVEDAEQLRDNLIQKVNEEKSSGGT